MQLADRIRDQVKELPDEVQREVLEFVEYLAHKVRDDDATWFDLSLESAVRGLEDETWPEYGDDDFVEKWQ